MANNYQSLLDIIKPQEEDQMMSSMAPEQIEALQPTPEITPEVQASNISNQVVENTINQAPSPPLDRRQALLEEFQKLRGGTDELAEARKRDRMLKIGGALGDALATIVKAQGQMSAKVPGVSVQEGAGLQNIAEMFQTAPELASDLTQRRQALMDEYRQLVTGEQDKLARDLKERQVKAYEDQVKAQVKKLEAAAKPKVSMKEEKPTIGEQTVDREFAKKFNEWRTGGKADYEENKKIFDEAIRALETGKVTTGATSGIGSRIPGVRTETRELETRVRKAVNGMLRATLGAQFTEEEGKRIFEQTFDPFASPEENIKNMQTELSRIEKRARDVEQQGKYFTKQKTLSGFQSMETKEDTLLSPKDQQALDWANNNPNDPRAIEIKRRLGR